MAASRCCSSWDDLMNETDDSVANLFTKGSHHRNISVAFLVQNLFHKNKHIRTISLNAHYMVLFKNPRDASQFASLARQMYPNKSAFAVEAYKDATKDLFVDLRPEQDQDLRLHTNVFPDETGYVYIPKIALALKPAHAEAHPQIGRKSQTSTSTSAPAGGLSWPTNCDCSDGVAGTTSTSAPAEGLSWPTNCDCSDGVAGTTSTSAPAEGRSWPTNCDCSNGGTGTTSTSAPAEGLSWPTN